MSRQKSRLQKQSSSLSGEYMSNVSSVYWECFVSKMLWHNVAISMQVWGLVMWSVSQQ